MILMLDETIVTETPPLYSCYGPIGEQVQVPISGGTRSGSSMGRSISEAAISPC